jgi:hypothetical protein
VGFQCRYQAMLRIQNPNSTRTSGARYDFLVAITAAPTIMISRWQMRGLIYPVVFLIAAILIGVGFLILRPQSLWAPAVATFSAIAGKVHGQAESHPSPFSRPKAVEKSPAARPEARSSASEGSVTVTVIALPPAVPARFPMAQEIIKGMTKSSVLASFTTPAATVTGADVAQLLERLVYLDPSSKRTTAIYFVDGKVIRAETYTQ